MSGRAAECHLLQVKIITNLLYTISHCGEPTLNNRCYFITRAHAVQFRVVWGRTNQLTCLVTMCVLHEAFQSLWLNVLFMNTRMYYRVRPETAQECDDKALTELKYGEVFLKMLRVRTTQGGLGTDAYRNTSQAHVFTEILKNLSILSVNSNRELDIMPSIRDLVIDGD